ncbi:MAG: ribose-phosphate pyrophosphokinase [bacterium]
MISPRTQEEKAQKELYDKLILIGGNSNTELSVKVSEKIGIPLANSIISRFSDGEIRVKILENVRGKDVFIIQSTCPPVNDNLMELLIIIDAVRRASANSITAIIPYFGYAKQEKKVSGREPITAKLVANLITVAGANRVVTVDLHSPAIQGFFDIPLDNLFAYSSLASQFVNYVGKLDKNNHIIVAPDAGSVVRARMYSEKMGLPIAVMFKRRPDVEEVECLEVVGDIQGKEVIIVDDMISTGKTIVNAAEKLANMGAKKIYVLAVHPVFCSNAIQLIEKSCIEKIFVTDTIPLKHTNSKIIVCSIADLISEVIKRIYFKKSISELFD